MNELNEPWGYDLKQVAQTTREVAQKYSRKHMRTHGKVATFLGTTVLVDFWERNDFSLISTRSKRKIDRVSPWDVAQLVSSASLLMRRSQVRVLSSQ